MDDTCDYDSSRGGYQSWCYKGNREFEVTVVYNEVESDTLVLCAACKDRLKRECRRHGYKVIIKFVGV